MTEHPSREIAPPPFLDDPALAAVLDALPRARLVGGCVRDAIAGRTVSDIDLATPDDPAAVIAALAAAGLKAAPTGLQHGTVTAISQHRGFEVTTLRRDVAADGRHAEVAWTDDWQVDAARRDFTINAMSMSRAGAVFDYFAGLADLAEGRVRFVGTPAARIAEDYLRILRYFRFQARYGQQMPDLVTLSALREGATGLRTLSQERVWSELKRILAAPDPRATLQLMSSIGVLETVLPEAADLGPLTRLIAAGAPPDPLLRLAALTSAGDVLADRLRFSTAERRLLTELAGPPPDPALDGADLRRALAETPADILAGRAWLAGGSAAIPLISRLGCSERPIFPISGRDALALGVPPGPVVGSLLQAVRAWWLNGGCVADALACRHELSLRWNALK